MRVLLSDGSGLTARQTASQLADGGHAVHVLSPDPICLARFTRRVRRVWRVPPYGAGPLPWLGAALRVYRDARIDVLLPTQEQVAVLAARASLLEQAGVRTVVPPFAALAQVQDKISAAATLAAAGLPQPESTVLRTPQEAAAWDRFPVFFKLPIGTAASGVHRVSDRAEAARAVSAAADAGAFRIGGLLAQVPAAGPLLMVQGVFAARELIAWHATVRLREGAGGGASHKRSHPLRAAREDLQRLGRHLGWHGALAADAITTGQELRYIDVNPRLVEPANARRAGTDLVGPLLELARGGTPAPQPAGRDGVLTHQLLLAILGAAQRTGRRGPVAAELLAAVRQAGAYQGSAEELTPLAGDPLAGVPVAMAAVATLAGPAAWRWFVGGSVRNYSISPEGWRELRDSQPPG
ncbi:MAG TPA: hypothetical protein VMH35_14945 [Streptosporangiaceae bacterium]|nr:hypothetical protein [Streptosporangiaceae bacterium]